MKKKNRKQAVRDKIQNRYYKTEIIRKKLQDRDYKIRKETKKIEYIRYTK